MMQLIRMYGMNRGRGGKASTEGDAENSAVRTG